MTEANNHLEQPSGPPVDKDYDSNPFSISFKGFGLLYDYARGIFFIMLFFGAIGFFFNFLDAFISTPQNNPYEYESAYSAPATTESSTIDGGEIALVLVIVMALILLVTVFIIAISAAVKGFVAAGTVSAAHKNNISIGQAFSMLGDRYGVLFVAELIATAKIVGGYILLIIPGVRAQMRYTSTPYLIMQNKDLTASQALDQSKALYKGHLMEVFGIYTVGGIIPFVGQAIAASGFAMSVKQLTEYAHAGKETPKTHWLNYLGFFIFLFFVAIGLGLGFLIFTLTR